jgi:hypothetical protein
MEGHLLRENEVQKGLRSLLLATRILIPAASKSEGQLLRSL